MNDLRNCVQDLQRLLSKVPSKTVDNSYIGSFEVLEREISATVDRLHAKRLENVIQSLAERAPTLESLEKIEGNLKSVFQQVRKKKARDDGPTKYRSLLNQTGDCVLTADAGTGLILDVNDVILNSLGYSREELFGLYAQDIDEALPSATSESWRSWVAEIKTRSEPFRIERAFRRKDGGSIPVELTVFLRNVSSQDCLVFFARDIAEHRAVEDRLRRRARFFGRLLDGSVDGILAFDRNCVVKFCSPALGKLWDVDRRELVGRIVWEAVPFLKELGEDSNFYKALEGKKVISRERSCTIADSEQIIFDIHYMPLRGESEEVLGGIAVVREMTRQAETERALAEVRQELEAQKSERTAVEETVHSTEKTEKSEQEDCEKDASKRAQQEREIENLSLVTSRVVRGYDRPLTDFLGRVASILEDLPPGSAARYAIEELEVAALNATELTEQLQAYAEKDLDASQLIDLGRLAEEMTHSFEHTVPPKVVFEKRKSGNELPIRADVGQIRDLILALVANASEALAEQQGIITVSVGTVEASREFLADCIFGENLPEGSYVYLEVTDTGKGMDENSLARAFVPFFSTKTGGSGFGLATVVGTVRRHRGAIRIKSTLHQGTTVRVVFPHRESWQSLLSRITAGNRRELKESVLKQVDGS